MVYQFGEFALDLTQQSLRGPGGEIALRPQAFSLLRLLIEHSPEVVARDEILDQVWGRHALSVNSLPQVIGEIRAALGESAADPRFIVTKHRRGYQFVGAVTRVEAQEPGTEPQETVAATRLAGRRPLLPAIAVLAVGLVVAAWVGLDRPVSPAGDSGSRPALAVLSFDNLRGTPDAGWVGVALADFVGTRLGHDEAVRLIPGEAVAGTRRQLSPARSDGLADVTLDELRRLLGADYLITGSFVKGAGETVSVSARMQDTHSGEVIASFSENGALDALGELTERLSADFRRALDLPATTPGTPSLTATTLELGPEAQQSYFRGLSLLRDQRATEAIAQFRQALATESDAPVLRAALAEAYRDAGYQVQALQQARLAKVASTDAPRRVRLAIDALAAALDYDWRAAERNYAALFSFFPDDERYGYLLLGAQIHTGSHAAAGATLDALATLSEDAQRDPRWIAAAADLARARGLPEEQRRLAEAGLAVAGDLDSERLQADMRLERADALQSLGELAAARIDLEFARDVYQRAGATREYAESLISLAQLERAQARFEAARTAANDAVDAYAALGFPSGEGAARTVLATILSTEGAYPDARAQLDRAVELQENSGNFGGLAAAKSNLAIVTERTGDLKTALSYYREAAAHYERANDQRGQASVLVNLGTSLARATRWSESVTPLESALALFRRIDDLRGQAFALSTLATVTGQLGDRQLSAQYNDEALAAYRQVGARMQVARVLYNIAIEARRSGDITRANESLAEAADIFADLGAQPYGTALASQLADLAMKRGDLVAAQNHIDRGHALGSEDPSHRARLLTAEGRLALQGGRNERARELFGQALALRETVGAEGWTLVSRLDLARVDLADGRLARAEESARELASRFAAINDPREQALSLVVAGEALLRQGRDQDVLAATERLRGLLADHPDFYTALEVSLLEARASKGRLANERLAWVIEQAEAHGFQELAERAAGNAAPQTAGEPG